MRDSVINWAIVLFLASLYYANQAAVDAWIARTFG